MSPIVKQIRAMILNEAIGRYTVLKNLRRTTEAESSIIELKIKECREMLTELEAK